MRAGVRLSMVTWSRNVAVMSFVSLLVADSWRKGDHTSSFMASLRRIACSPA
jgi:hypothetical protein